MSLKTEEISCALCHAYLFPEDDVVYCPECGAPHHRECYAHTGHCALEELHGTDRQYDRLKEKKERESREETENAAHGEAEGLITCGMCREKYDFSLSACPKCGAPNVARMGGSFVNFDFLGGVPADYDIGEGVTADEAKRFVAANTPRYIPKFAVLNRKNKISWNWMAFLFPSGWMLSRKMYKNGIIAGLLTVTASLLYLPMIRAINNLGFADGQASAQLMEGIYSNLPNIGTAVMLASLAGFLVNTVIRFASALFGDYLYKGHTVAAIKEIRAESTDADFDYRKKGGVNIFMFFIGGMAVQYLPTLIAMLI